MRERKLTDLFVLSQVITVDAGCDGVMNCVPAHDAQVARTVPEMYQRDWDNLRCGVALDRIVVDTGRVVDVSTTSHTSAGPMEDHAVRGTQLATV